MDLFYHIHKSDLENRTPLRIVTSLGAKLWRDRLNENKPVELKTVSQGEAEDDRDRDMAAEASEDEMPGPRKK